MSLARFLVPAFVFLTGIAPAASVTVPFVGCPSDGQMGPQPIPKGKPVPVSLPAAMASRLAFYRSTQWDGVLAPRGWHCAHLYGSNGWFTVVAQEPVTPASFLGTKPKPISGPAIQLSQSDSGTSGRFEVARLIARYFPERRAFLKSVIDEGIEAASDFREGPFQTDILVSRRKDVVEYLTPAGKEGLGTVSRLSPSVLPIHAVAAVGGARDEDWAGYVLAVRLPKDQEDLAPAILDWAAKTYWETK